MHQHAVADAREAVQLACTPFVAEPTEENRPEMHELGKKLDLLAEEPGVQGAGRAAGTGEH